MCDRDQQRMGQVGLMLLVTLWVGTVAAQTQQPSQWKVGDAWVFRSTGGLPPKESDWSRKVVEALPGDRFKVVTETSSNLTFDNEGNSIDNRGPDFTWRRFNLPLEVGKRWKHQRKIEGANWSGTEESEWQVKATEKITVPAGSFDCVRVDGSAYRSWTSPGGNQGYKKAHTETTYWYCPAIKWAAKWEIQDEAYTGAPVVKTVSELTSFVAAP